MPEPGDVRAVDDTYQVGYYQENSEHPRQGRGRQHSKDKSKSSFNFTHTSCIMAIRNYVEKMQAPKNKKKKVRAGTQENAEKLICSLKNDIQMISKYEEDIACNPSKPPASDPFFVLSAMMCKINKLETILLAQPDGKEQLAKRKEMIMMARCIKKTLLDQAQCDHRIMQDKQRKMVCLVKSLDMFEKDIRYATRGVKKLCCRKPSAGNVAISNSAEKGKSPSECTAKPPSRPVSPAKSNLTLTKELSKKTLSAKTSEISQSKSPSPDNKQYDITGKLLFILSQL